MQPCRKALFLIFLLMTSPALAASPSEHKPGPERIGHIIVLFLENRSFDHLYGLFPGADAESKIRGSRLFRSRLKAANSRPCRQ